MHYELRAAWNDTLSHDGRMYIWSAASSALLCAPVADRAVVNCVQSAPGSGLRLASCGIDTTVKLWAASGDDEHGVVITRLVADTGIRYTLSNHVVLCAHEALIVLCCPEPSNLRPPIGEAFGSMRGSMGAGGVKQSEMAHAVGLRTWCFVCDPDQMKRAYKEVSASAMVEQLAQLKRMRR
jgi:hypothetical protein